MHAWVHDSVCEAVYFPCSHANLYRQSLVYMRLDAVLNMSILVLHAGFFHRQATHACAYVLMMQAQQLGIQRQQPPRYLAGTTANGRVDNSPAGYEYQDKTGAAGKANGTHGYIVSLNSKHAGDIHNRSAVTEQPAHKAVER